MGNTQFLHDHEHSWITAMGAFLAAEGRVVFRGKDLHHELKDLPWMGLLIYGITGRIPGAKQTRFLESIWTLSTSYPDPRIWNNRIAALAGTARSTAVLAISGATAVTEATVYGGRPIIGSIDLISSIKEQMSLEEQKPEGERYTGKAREEWLVSLLRALSRQYRGFPGFGRPVAERDERIGPIMQAAKEAHLADGPTVQLAFEINEVLKKHWRGRYLINISGLVAALVIDMGFSRRDFYHYSVLSFSGGMLPCYIDAANQPEGGFYPLRCAAIRYNGKVGHRKWVSRETETEQEAILSPQVEGE